MIIFRGDRMKEFREAFLSVFRGSPAICCGKAHKDNGVPNPKQVIAGLTERPAIRFVKCRQAELMQGAGEGGGAR